MNNFTNNKITITNYSYCLSCVITKYRFCSYIYRSFLNQTRGVLAVWLLVGRRQVDISYIVFETETFRYQEECAVGMVDAKFRGAKSWMQVRAYISWVQDVVYISFGVPIKGNGVVSKQTTNQID